RAITTISPTAAAYIASIMALLVSRVISKSLFESISKVFKSVFLINLFGNLLEHSGRQLLESGVFTRLGVFFGEALGEAISTVAKSIPNLITIFLQVAHGFTEGLLDSLGILGKAIKGLANLTLRRSVIDAILF